jgi:hypothetical protein
MSSSPHQSKMIVLSVITLLVVIALPVQWQKNNDNNMSNVNYSHLVYAIFLSFCLYMAWRSKQQMNYANENMFLWIGLAPTILGCILLVLMIAFFVDRR